MHSCCQQYQNEYNELKEKVDQLDYGNYELLMEIEKLDGKNYELSSKVEELEADNKALRGIISEHIPGLFTSYNGLVQFNTGKIA